MGNQFFKVGDVVKSACGSVGEIMYIVKETDNDNNNNAKCIIQTGFPFEGAEIIVPTNELHEFIPSPEVLTSPF